MSSHQDFEIEEVFESAVTIIRNLPQEGPFKPSDELKLKLYALYKQATCGPNTTAKPRFYQIVEQYKWEAWMKLGDMPREEAMAKYIAELKDVMSSIPGDQTDPEDNKHFEEVLGKKFYDYWFNGRGKFAAQGEDCSTTAVRGNGGTHTSGLNDELRDQFALAVLRIQYGLDRTEGRLDRLEEQMRNRTLIGETHAGGPDTRANKLLSFLGQVNWFHLSYPILVYVILRALERQRRGPPAQ